MSRLARALYAYQVTGGQERDPILDELADGDDEGASE